MILLSILILSIPTLWELWSERKGEDPKKKGRSMLVRAGLMVVCSVVAAELMDHRFILRSFLLSFAIFFAVFDYAINLILGRKPWYSYLSKSPLDRLWSGWDWRLRMLIRGVVFVGSLIWFLN